jgi:outer membrane protein assembly factor BamE (lipoprotein component of BamABCDE complex)
MAALKQVLNPRTFAEIQPGMAMEDVRKLLGKPMKVTEYALKKEVHYDWRWRDGPNESDSQVFTVIFSPDLRVISAGSVRDPALDRAR